MLCASAAYLNGNFVLAWEHIRAMAYKVSTPVLPCVCVCVCVCLALPACMHVWGVVMVVGVCVCRCVWVVVVVDLLCVSVVMGVGVCGGGGVCVCGRGRGGGGYFCFLLSLSSLLYNLVLLLAFRTLPNLFSDWKLHVFEYTQQNAPSGSEWLLVTLFSLVYVCVCCPPGCFQNQLLEYLCQDLVQSARHPASEV